MLYKNSRITMLFFISVIIIPTLSVIQVQTKKNPSTKTKQKNKRRNKIQKNKKKTHRAIKAMTRDELGPAKEQYLRDGQKGYACSCLERMITLENDTYKQKALRLELGNLYFDIEKFDKAGKTFDEFIAMYPNSKDTEYALFKTVQCHWQETLSHDRDQSKTNECLEMANKYLKNEQHKKYRKNVEQLAQQCYQKLVDHEAYVCKFYLKKGRCKAAQERLAYVREKYLTHVPVCEENVLCLECECAAKKNDTELLEQKTAELRKKFPQQAKQATKKSKKRNYIRRF